MDITITPAPLSGTLPAISSKSMAHRAMIACMLSDRPTQVRLNLLSEDIRATQNCIHALGGECAETEYGLRISPLRKDPTAHPTLDCGESGSTARFLLPVTAALFCGATLTGSGRLPARPFSDVCRALRENGCAIARDHLPIRVEGKLQSGRFSLPGNVSSQYISGLLFALPKLAGDSEIILTTPLESVGYVDMTLSVLRDFGIEITPTPCGYLIKGNQTYRSPGCYSVEGDWSNSAFWLCAGALGREITVTGLNPHSLQGDKAVADILSRFGAVCHQTDETVTVAPGTLRGIDIDAQDIPDLVPALAAVAACASGRTRIYNAARLRLKESDRLETVTAALSALGADIAQTEDGLCIRGREGLTGGCADSFGDHRIAMMLAVAALRADGEVTLTRAQAADKSYPTFFNDYQTLGGIIHVINPRS